MKRFLYIFTVAGIALAATSCGSTDSREVLMDDFGNTYSVSARAYGTDRVMTEDGRVWNCGIEVVPNATYEVEFCDCNTEDTSDDLISDVVITSEGTNFGFYTTFAVKYDESGIITTDGNIWDCDVEGFPDATYEVTFCDSGTEDITDDVIVFINVE